MIGGFLSILTGSLLIYFGALSMAAALLPSDFAREVGRVHGKWMRESVLNLPPTKDEKHDN